jgi:hypothetical protein
VRRSDGAFGILPVVRRESSLVVVCLLFVRIDRLLYLSLFHFLVSHSRGKQNGHDVSLVLWIHVFDFLCHALAFRYGRSAHVVVVYSQNLCHHQGRLKTTHYMSGNRIVESVGMATRGD